MSQTFSIKQNAAEQSSKPRIDLFIAGIGAVGGTLLNLIEDLNHSHFDLKILGICNSKNTAWNSDGFNSEQLINDLPCGEETDWSSIPFSLIQYKTNHTIFVDATGSSEVAEYYGILLEAGVHIATPSKIANTLDQSYFNRLTSLSNEGKVEYRYETTVGAGLPILNTINGLIESGDEITEISGVVSGTMTYLFSELESGKTFSEAIKSAKANGYSEPDPRDDLSGEDIARKFLILARTCGLNIERNDVQVDSLVPSALEHSTLDEFLDAVESEDNSWNEKIQNATNQNNVLRYTGRFNSEGINIGVQEVPKDSPFGGLNGTNNLIQIKTRRYGDSPITIQGPGAGKAVTAAGILTDVIEISKSSVLSIST